MKRIIFLLFLFVMTKAYAQFTTYSESDNVKSCVMEVDNMDPYEIKMYNSWIKEGYSKNACLNNINAARAQDNLIAAPATIINYMGNVVKDSTEDVNGLNEIIIQLINTTPKTIKEIYFDFEFSNANGQVYDTKTGSDDCILKFTNLKGRTSSTYYNDIADNIFAPYHILDYKEADYFKPFYNKTATQIKLIHVDITYNDGTTTHKAAIWDDGFIHTDKILDNGPLEPIVTYLTETHKGE